MDFTPREATELAMELDRRNEEKERARVLAGIARNPKPRRGKRRISRSLRLILSPRKLQALGFDEHVLPMFSSWWSPLHGEAQQTIKIRTDMLHEEWCHWLTTRCDCVDGAAHDCSFRYEQPDYGELVQTISEASAKRERIRPHWYLRLATYRGVEVRC